MCILFIALGQHPRYPLIVAANRDEEFSRPSQTARYWEDEPDIYGGRDLRAGGTWLAVSKAGRLAAITNLRAPDLYRDDAKSRGGLIPDYLLEPNTELFRARLQRNRQQYNPFNLMFGDINRLTVFDSVNGHFTALDKGFHSVSNGPVDDYWPKMSRGVSLLEAHIAQRPDKALDTERLFADMCDSTQADETVLPHTGIGLEAEKHLSSIFIPGDDYGTRTTSLLTFDGNEMVFHERDYDAGAQLRHNHREIIRLVGG